MSEQTKSGSRRKVRIAVGLGLIGLLIYAVMRRANASQFPQLPASAGMPQSLPMGGGYHSPSSTTALTLANSQTNPQNSPNIQVPVSNAPIFTFTPTNTVSVRTDTSSSAQASAY